MKISVFGAGYVGLVSAACLAKLGHELLCMDVNAAKVAELNRGNCPIFEPGLPDLITEAQANHRLSFTADFTKAIRHASCYFIATGTPSLDNGSVDLSQIYAVIDAIIAHLEQDAIVVIKSTVPVGTALALQEYIQAHILKSGRPFKIHLASNPEFLREGSALHDFLQPDRIVLGGEEPIVEVLQEIYAPLIAQGTPVLTMSCASAELSKYAANTMLASRISFMNHMSQIAEQMGANIEDIKQVLSLDHRIGNHFLEAGIGFGGSCFPKDVRALYHIVEKANLDTRFLKSVIDLNEIQKQWVIKQLQQYFNHNLQNKRIGIWGLSFKPNTDDIREASSLMIIYALLQANAVISVYDPVAMPKAQKELQEYPIHWCSCASEVVHNLDALVIATEWDEFKQYSLPLLSKQLQGALLIDGRNCYALSEVTAAGISAYLSVGRPPIQKALTKETCHA